MRERALAWLVGLMAAAFGGCTSSEPAVAGPGDPPLAPCVECPPSFPAGPCAAGTAPLEGAECSRVGWSGGCPLGFAPAKSGWGCEPVVATSACTGATMPKLGARACEPIDDCTAPFPPTGTSVLVDANGIDDATHARTIGDALTKVATGGTVAVEAGTYLEALSIKRDVTLVGRCTDKVRVESVSGATTTPGLNLASAGTKVSISGLTFSGHRGGVVVTAGTLDARALRLEANRELGLVAVGSKTRVRFEGGVVRGTLPSATVGLGRGVDVEGGATVELVSAAVEQNADIGVFAEGANIIVDGSIVRTTATGASGKEGRGVYGKLGSAIKVQRSSITDNHTMGIFASGARTKLTVEDSFVARTLPDGAKLFGRGITVLDKAEASITNTRIADNVDTGLECDGATVTATDVAIEGTRSTPQKDYGAGAVAKRGGSLRLVRAAVVGNRSSGVAALGATTILEGSAVVGTLADTAGRYGMGAVVAEGGHLEIGRSVIDDSRFVGVFALLETSSVSLTRSLVRNVKAQEVEEPLGHAVVSMERARVDLLASVVERSVGAGLIVASSTGSVRSSVLREHTVGLATLDGTTLHVSARAPEEFELIVSDDTRFERNGTRIGAGPIPLPPTPAIVARK